MIPTHKRIQAKWALLIMMIGLGGRHNKKPKRDGDLRLLVKTLSRLPKPRIGLLLGKKLKMKDFSLLSSISIKMRMSGNLNSVR